MKIICFGDSLTRGITFVKGRMRILKDNYPSVLGKLTESISGIEVLNKGVFNDNSDFLLSRLEKDVLAENPDAVLISVGGNDCNFKWEEVALEPDGNHQPIVPLDRYLENLSFMVREFQIRHITPYLLTLPPLDPTRYYRSIADRYGSSIGHFVSFVGGIEHWHGMYNRRLKMLARELNVALIDVRSFIKSAGDLNLLISDDGIHLTKEGYLTMSQAVLENLKKYQLIPEPLKS